MEATNTEYADVVAVGARCAGAATALQLARAGLDVVLVDRATLPRDTTSTHAIARGGVVQLQRWGLLDALVAGGAPPVRAVTFVQRDHTAAPEVLRLPVKAKAGVDFLLAPRRWALDALLLDAAVAAGARVLAPTQVSGVLRDGSCRVVGVTGRDRDGRTVEVRARLVVGADGVHSRTAGLLGADVLRSHGVSGACFYTYVAGLDCDGFEFHYAPDAFGGVFPTHHEEACVWLIRPPDHAQGLVAAGAGRTEAWSSALDHALPGLGSRVRAADVVAPVRGAVGLPNHVRRATGPGWALVGDAGYHRDPITGHGITDAFRDAELLADAVGAWLVDEVPETEALATYARERDQAIRDVFVLTQDLARFPPTPRFLDLQSRLSRALDVEARSLASRPLRSRRLSSA